MDSLELIRLLTGVILLMAAWWMNRASKRLDELDRRTTKLESLPAEVTRLRERTHEHANSLAALEATMALRRRRDDLMPGAE